MAINSHSIVDINTIYHDDKLTVDIDENADNVLQVNGRGVNHYDYFEPGYTRILEKALRGAALELAAHKALLADYAAA